MRQQKVVVTGNVNSDILIKKLIKTGKHVELWPEPTDSKKNKPGKSENKEKQNNDTETESSEEINQSSENDNETGKVKLIVDTSHTSKTVKSTNGSGEVHVINGNKLSEGCATGKTGEVHVQEVKPEVRRQTVVLPAGPVTQKKVSVAVQFPNDDNEESSANEKTVGGGKKKKKKGKGKVNNNNANEGAVEQCGDDPGTGGSGNRSHGQGHGNLNFHGMVHPGSVPVSSPANENPPRHYTNNQLYPPHYYAPPPAVAPVCTVSYHTAYPSSSSYGAAYYAPPQAYQYAHVMNSGTEMEPRPYTYESESYTSSQASDEFVYFSDENPNACSVM